MNVEPAHIDQIRKGRDGQMVMIDRDAGGVAEELRRIDPGLSVRFSEQGHYWVIYYAHCASHKVHDTGCDVCREAITREAGDLVTTVNAWQNRFGVWEGLDQRVVEHVRKIAHKDYDFLKELERHNAQVDKERRDAFREKIGPLAEQAAHAVRKDLGAKYKGRIFKPKDLPVR